MLTSQYWQEQIDLTQAKLAEIMNDDLFGVHSVKGDENSLTLDTYSEQYKTLVAYLNLCKLNKKEALEVESGTSNPIITYVPRV